jgi:phosphoglycerol transferase MdoB-like AlkP superfamily enzyme
MIGNLLLYAANRATQGAVDNVARKASWGGFAVFLLLVGTIFSLIVAFWVLNDRYDAPVAGAIIAGGCFVVGLLCLLMPRFLEWLGSKAKTTSAPVHETVSAVQEEVAEAVDYFGPIRVVGSAFMLGLGIARSFKR